jgi:hypothetical protein
MVPPATTTVLWPRWWDVEVTREGERLQLCSIVNPKKDHGSSRVQATIEREHVQLGKETTTSLGGANDQVQVVALSRVATGEKHLSPVWYTKANAI